MPQLVKKRRSGWAVLAAGALVASLLAVAASPAGAATDEADHTTKLSACVGDALGDQMFTDVSDMHAFKDAINCVAYYGITNGTGDGSTYSPNDDVTRAQMAVFIARAAGAAGVELKSGSGGFSDIGDVWQGAQDAINGLAASGMIATGGAYRPDDAVTRAEMATFLIGFLNKASSSVMIDANGAIQLSAGTPSGTADDYFGDARATVPAGVDAQISAIYELGITKGAGAAAVQDDTKPPLDFNYEPHGTVDRGQMAAFITRALAHTSVRPEGVSAQFNGTSVVLSARDENFHPKSNVVIDVFTTDAAGADLAFRSNGTCGDVVAMLGGTYRCEIDGADHLTGGDGDATVALAVATGGSVVWAWTGDDEDTVDDDTVLFRLDVAAAEQTTEATRVRVSTDFAGAKAHLGSSVLYTVQLEDGKGPVNVGTDGKKPAQFLVTLRTFALIDSDNDPATALVRNPQGASVVTTLPLTTDGDGKATFSVSGLPDPNTAVKGDKFQVDIWILPRPNGNAPAAGTSGSETYFIGAAPGVGAAPSQEAGATGLIEVRAGAVDTDATTRDGLVFSTAAVDRATATVSVKPAAGYVAAMTRGASNRATVSVTDQYGDPIAGAKVVLTTSLTNEGGSSPIVIGGGRALAVGRDGTYTFGYTRTGATAVTETLTATWTYTQDSNNDGTADDPASLTGTATVEWAVAGAAAEQTGAQIQAFDTETNTIFVGATGSTVVVNYDSNDRFDIDPNGSGGGDLVPSNYAAFEKALSKASGTLLQYAAIRSGTRATNTFTLVQPAAN
jgi:hypothetical protein